MIPARVTRYGIAGALLAWLLLFAATARPAEWIRFTFTAPADSNLNDGAYVSGVGRYRMETSATTSSWDSLRIYRAPAVEGVPVKPAGQPCTLWVSQTVAPLTSRTYRLLAIDNRGNRSDPSNFAVVATGFPDTIVGLIRPALGLGYAFVRTYARPVGWSLTPGDSASIRAAHQEELQRDHSRRICELYGYWVLRGERVVCP